MFPFVSLALISCVGRKTPPEPPVAEARSFTILAFNDVYRIEGFPEADQGGLARVRTLRASLEAGGDEVLVMGAGDFLYPSLPSRLLNGEQMIDTLNHLDGDGAAADPRLLVTFGNHEFDKDSCSGGANLAARIAQSGFTWVATNVRFKACEDTPAIAGDNLVTTSLVEVGGVKVGVVGVIYQMEEEIAFVEAFDEPFEATRAATAALRAQGAEVVVGLTHQRVEQDAAMLEALGAEGPDLVVGGHEHTRQAQEVGGRWLVKADADARSAAVWNVTVQGGAVSVTHRIVDLDAAVTPDPAVQAVVDGWSARHQQMFCEKAGDADGCLDQVVGRTRTDLVGEETRIRRYETSLGNFVTDNLRATFGKQGADAAIVNSGSLRLNQDLPAGAVVQRRHIETLFAYPAETVLIEVTGATLQAALERSIQDWTGNGHWLQVSGIAFVHDPDAGTVTGLSRVTEGGLVPIAAGDTLQLATVSYLTGGGDSYDMLVGAKELARGADLKQIVLDALDAAEPEGIAPVADGRICNTQDNTECGS